MSDKIKVLIVDDMLSIRLLLQSLFKATTDIEVVGTAATPAEAREVLKKTDVDVITLDVEMPEMDGITFLSKLMKLKPTPVIMISTLTGKGTAAAVKALELGAIDVIGKPSQKVEEIKEYRDEILEKVRAAACSTIGDKKARRSVPTQAALNSTSIEPTRLIDDIFPKRTHQRPNSATSPLIAIGSSTGGPSVLREILHEMKPQCPPIVIVQHMSDQFITPFVKSLDLTADIQVIEGKDGTTLEAGHAYFAPGNRHMSIHTKSDGRYKIELHDLEKINRHRPSVDLLFRSVAASAGKMATGVLLTGMGDDGARCLKEIKDEAGQTITQDEASCVVYGMPRAAVKIDPTHDVKNIKQIIKTLQEIKI